MNKVTRWLWGLVLIALGVILGMRAFGIDINIFFPGWWTLFIIVPSFIGLFAKNGKTGSAIMLAIGVCLLLGSLNVVSFRVLWRLIVPIILVIVGLSIICGDALKRKIRQEMKKLHNGNEKEYWATFGGQKVNFKGEKFEGARLEAVFGGVQCDLREAKIEEDVMITANSTFGGITIRVPEDVNVKVASTSVFGGVSDNRKRRDEEAEHTVYINATCIFGGVEVK